MPKQADLSDPHQMKDMDRLVEILAQKIRKQVHIQEELELPPVKVHCSILAEDAIKAAIADYKNKQGK